MLVLLLVGCLTPESFSERYAERLCEEIVACGGEIDVADCEAEYDRKLTPEICPDWDAASAAECLNSEEASWCGEPEEGLVVPDSCKDLGCG